MEVLSFELSGKMAHFRKYYANNTALSYFIPPRTTLMGILGAIMGFPRDSYYERFSSHKLRIGIRVLSPLKKSFHRLNLLMIKSPSDFRGQKGRVQIPFEVVTGQNIRQDEVRYRIYLGPQKDHEEIFDQIKTHLISQPITFHLSFGVANFSAQLSNIHLYTPESVIEKHPQGDQIEVYSALSSERVLEIHLDERRIILDEELHPADFVADYDREVKKMVKVLHATGPQTMPLVIKGNYLELHRKDSIENILFLE